MDIKALLIQIRQDPQVIEEERSSFIKYSGLKDSQMHVFNVFENPSFDFHLLKNYTCLFVGGASEASVLEPQKYSFVNSLVKLMGDCIDHSYPVFASCFGFQAAVLALGGEIIKDDKNFEMGTYPLKLTASTQNDPIYQGIPNGFYAISVHQEKCTELPGACELLAYSDDCIHSFRVKDKPFWAFQFHPELDKQNLITRLKAYQDRYTEDSDHYMRVIRSLKETPESNKLVRNFVQHLQSNF